MFPPLEAEVLVMDPAGTVVRVAKEPTDVVKVISAP
jgi:hypothetical protein